MATVVRGVEVREPLLEEVSSEVQRIKEKHGIVPGLVTILVGEDPASKSYVSLKIKTAQRLGFHEIQDNQPNNITTEELIALIKRYNDDVTIHGILVQLPLPFHIDEISVINSISPLKDVDGLHPINVGNMVLDSSNYFKPCTAAACQHLMSISKREIEGSHVVILGRSSLVGKPLANMLLQKGKNANATVTVAHSRSKDLSSLCQLADFLIVAVGKPKLVEASWVKEGAVVIDVGTTQVGEKKSMKTGKLIPVFSGDVDFDAVQEKASFLTPVPGGVGPLTITFLMKNTLESLKRSLGIC